MRKKQSGFGVVEVIIIVVVLALVGIGGWYVWNANQKGQPTNGSNSNSNSSANNATATDPYADWKSYCDTTHKACFKYPADWQIVTDSSPDYEWAQVTDTSGSVIVTYSNPDTRDGSVATFYTGAVEDLAQPATGYKVIGGYVVPSGLAPGYWLVSGIFLKDTLQPGQQSEYVNSPRFVNKDGFYATLTAAPKNATASEAESRAWFASDEAKTASLVIKSFYLQ